MASATSSLRDALAALRNEQAKTQKAIDAIEVLLRDMDDERAPHLPFAAIPPISREPEPTDHALPYANMTLADAAVSFLRQAGRPQKLTAIVNALWTGGIRSGSQKPKRMMYNILTGRLDKELAKFGSDWGLKEWEQK